ncbi:MAG: ribosome maturation factor RimP [Acidimicrobiia bacterium]|nr:ribosome maturation factor RimP [Acidimicrobiia bacterium]
MLIDEVRTLIEPWLAAERLELDDLELKGSGPGRTLRVVVDADEPVDLDRIAEVSNGISRLLDAEADIDDPYRLEVTSPGLERPLRTPRHFQKSVGREVSVKFRRDGETILVKGRLAEAGDDRATVEGEDGSSTDVSYDEVVKARTVFRWEAAPKPGKK